ncbi:hypothetical protein [Adhaeribacter terreus]|uniref:Uncharacterized protein n=1 Tax=Adhaeribacter terreus TaxID=529703 RepID=A0ABW0E7U1_9BACT
MEILKISIKENIVIRDIILSVFTGSYFLLVWLFHVPVINYFFNKVGIWFNNPYMGFTFFILYLVTPISAGLLTFKLKKFKQFSFDKTLINNLVSSLTFALPMFVLIFLSEKDFSIFALIGVLFFSTLFSFINAALSATFLSRILTKQPQ